jgi:S1-C subfamily serine protease
MRRRAWVLLAASMAALFVAMAVLPVLAFAADVCPNCQAPLQPGAKFCTRCGHKLDPGATPAKPPPAPDALSAVVQVVAGHDRELSSAFAEIAYGSKLEVDSILGSGFQVGPGEFITESGVVAGAHEVTIRTAGGSAVAARVVGYDPLIGIGLLSAELPGIPVLPRRDGAPALGESLKSMGFSSSSRVSAAPMSTPGVVSAVHRDGVRFHTLEDYIQTDASRPDGFSGGPVVDSEGRLVGMSTAGVRGPMITSGAGSGISFTIPVTWIDRSVAWIKAGRPARPWLGMCASASTRETRAQYHLPAEAHWVVDEVFPDGPAAAAGLRRGDGLLRFNGEAISSSAPWLDRILGAVPGTRVEIEVARAAERSTLHLGIVSRPEHPKLPGLQALRFYGGIELEERSDSLVVTRVLPGSSAHDEKIAVGDVLESLFVKKNLERAEQNNTRWRPVHTSQDLETRLASAYSDVDFFAGARFRSHAGERKVLVLFDLADPPGVF